MTIMIIMLHVNENKTNRTSLKVKSDKIFEQNRFNAQFISADAVEQRTNLWMCVDKYEKNPILLHHNILSIITTECPVYLLHVTIKIGTNHFLRIFFATICLHWAKMLTYEWCDRSTLGHVHVILLLHSWDQRSVFYANHFSIHLTHIFRPYKLKCFVVIVQFLEYGENMEITNHSPEMLVKNNEEEKSIFFYDALLVLIRKCFEEMYMFLRYSIFGGFLCVNS